MKLTPRGVCVLWEWEWIEDVEEPSIESQEDSDHDSDSTDSEVPPSCVATIPVTHTVTFKYIGTVQSPAYQNTLKKVCELRTEGHEVSVNIFCEPENPVDSKAIAFRCQIGDEWHTIGYIVREALDSVHTAIRNQDIISVRFSWVNYLVSWSRSGPGYYARINITV